MLNCLTPHQDLSPLNPQQEVALWPNLGAIRPPDTVALQPMEFSGATVTDDDPIVMDALPQSLGHSIEFIHSSTPISGLLHNLHFVTSPKPPHCSSINLPHPIWLLNWSSLTLCQHPMNQLGMSRKHLSQMSCQSNPSLTGSMFSMVSP